MLNKTSKMVKYIFDFMSLNSTDIILSSYPKSGNTWVRYIFYNYFNNTSSDDALPSLEIIDNRMVEIGVGNVSSSWYFSSFPRIVKTHLTYNRFFKRNKSILIIRNPLDVMISFYHYARASRSINYGGNIESFAMNKKMGLRTYFEHYISWRNSAGLVIKYEELKQNPSKKIIEMLLHCGIPVDYDRLKNAINYSTMDYIRKSQAKSMVSSNTKFKSDFQFARSGKSNVGEKELPKNVLILYNELKSEYNFDLY